MTNEKFTQFMKTAITACLILLIASEQYEWVSIRKTLLVLLCVEIALYFDYLIYRRARYGPELSPYAIIMIYLMAPFLWAWSISWIFNFPMPVISSSQSIPLGVVWVILIIHPYCISVIAELLKGIEEIVQSS